MYREDFLINGNYYCVDAYLEEGPTRMDSIFIVNVTVERGGEIIKEKSFQFTSEKETKQFIEDLKEQRIDLL